MKGLMLHGGDGRKIDMQELAGIWTPAPTKTWKPVPHIEVINEVLRNLEANQLKVANLSMSVAKAGNRFFGLIEVENGQDDYGLVIGARNSHDQVFPVGIAVGSQVFVCSNLAFSAEIVLSRKHTVNVIRDFPSLVVKAMGQLTEYRKTQNERIGSYKSFFPSMLEVNDFLIRSVDARVMANADIPKVLNLWRGDYQKDLGDTAWRLFNCYTEALKHIAIAELPPRTMRLHGMMDILSGAVANGSAVPALVSEN